ncbi:MAG: tRNA 2-thiouridine(34) synthase MnmA [Anaerolineaceae bacterium]|nr:tRNA 2-thiouridine(34) synthase MnmA [Anaerolineaceae bacterium]
MTKVIVGMSGGVDSAAAAYLLKEAGYEVIGLTLRTDSQEGRCCEIDDARAAAWKLHIRYYAPNVISDFEEKVKKPFFNAYLQGRTPNPCIECNRYVKWDRMMYFMSVLDADYVATGHYAFVEQLENGRFTVRQASFAEKDQTYMLYKLTQEQLAHTLMPLGKYSKPEVRSIAEQAGLAVAQKRDSQEICFVTDGNYADYIEKDPTLTAPEAGNFVDENGKIMGKHHGIIHYTVGQRKGLGIAAGYPVYVTRINTAANEVVLGEEKSLYSSEIRCTDLNYLSIPGLESGEKIRARVKIRYHHEGEWASIKPDTGETVRIIFEKPVRAATPGQSAVFYDEENRVIGGGIITNSSR